MSPELQTVMQWCVTYGYAVLFAGVLVDVPVPGETFTLVAGVLASGAGGQHFNLGLVIVIAFAAAILGDNASFYLGRRFARPRLQRGLGSRLLSPQSMQTADGYFVHYGAWTVFLARFITGLRVVVVLAAGTLGMSWPRFLLADAAAAFVWASGVSLLGYFFGRSWHLLHHWLSSTSWIVLGVALVSATFLYIRGAMRRNRSKTFGDDEHALGSL